MRHAKAGVKLNRTTSHRNAMFRNMVTSLLKHNKIRTTDAKAKELRRWADKIITLAKRGDLHARRQALSIVREKDVVHKLFEEADERFGDIPGGYTRIVKLGYRAGDAAKMSMIEVLDTDARDGGKTKKKASHYETPKDAPVDAKPDEPEVDPSEAETVEMDAIGAAELEAEVKADEEAAPEPEEAPEPEAEAAPAEEVEAAPAEEAEAAPEEPAPPADEEKPAEEEEAPKKDAPEAS